MLKTCSSPSRGIVLFRLLTRVLCWDFESPIGHLPRLSAGQAGAQTWFRGCGGIKPRTIWPYALPLLASAAASCIRPATASRSSSERSEYVPRHSRGGVTEHLLHGLHIRPRTGRRGRSFLPTARVWRGGHDSVPVDRGASGLWHLQANTARQAVRRRGDAMPTEGSHAAASGVRRSRCSRRDQPMQIRRIVRRTRPWARAATRRPA
jgi:hypothetical protein